MPSRPSMKTRTYKKITLRYLENAGAYYLGRFSSSRENFRTVMQRKIEKSCKDHPEQDKQQCERILNSVIEKFERLGYINDAAYADSLYKSMRRQGKSLRVIRSRMLAKGINKEQIARTAEKFTPTALPPDRGDFELHDYEQKHTNLPSGIDTLDDDFLSKNSEEYVCALIACRKKKIGGFKDLRPGTSEAGHGPVSDARKEWSAKEQKERQKELMKMARAGFSYDVSCRALATPKELACQYIHSFRFP